MVGRLDSFWEGLFSENMLVSGRVFFSTKVPKPKTKDIVLYIANNKNLGCHLKVNKKPTRPWTPERWWEAALALKPWKISCWRLHCFFEKNENKNEKNEKT